MNVTRWPHRSLAAVPGEHIAVRLADEVRRLAFDEESPCDLDRLCTLGGFKYQLAVLDTGCRGHEALLVPRVEGGFDILVDPVPTRGRAVHDEVARARLSRRRMRFRIAHEIGHSFFYDRRCRPARRLLGHSDAEEAFCDAFANALLVPPSVVARCSPTPKAILDLANKLDVSVEAAGRAFAKSIPRLSVLGLRPVPRGNRVVGAIVVLWSAGSTRFSANAELRNPWIEFAERERDTEQVLDLGTKRGVFRARIAKLGRSYYVAALLSGVQAHAGPDGA